jgi:hypothetical protein
MQLLLTAGAKALASVGLSGAAAGAAGATAAAGAATAGATAAMTGAQALQIGGTVLSTGGAIAGGIAAKKSADFESDQLKAQGKAQLAEGSRRAELEDRQKRLVMSRARAVGATSGGGVDNSLLGAIEEEGTYRTLVANWEGEDALSGMNTQAAARRTTGRSKRTGGYLTAFDSLMSGGSSLMEKYS